MVHAPGYRHVLAQPNQARHGTGCRGILSLGPAIALVLSTCLADAGPSTPCAAQPSEAAKTGDGPDHRELGQALSTTLPSAGFRAAVANLDTALSSELADVGGAGAAAAGPEGTAMPDCVAAPSEIPALSIDAGTSPTVRWPSLPSLKIAATPGWPEALSVILCLATGSGAVWSFVLSAKRARRRRRHMCSIPVQVATPSGPLGGEVVKISRMGAQIRVHDRMPPNNIVVTVSGRGLDIPGRVSWSNCHYMGIRFDQTLPRGMASAIAHRVRPVSIWPRQRQSTELKPSSA